MFSLNINDNTQDILNLLHTNYYMKKPKMVKINEFRVGKNYVISKGDWTHDPQDIGKTEKKSDIYRIWTQDLWI